MKGVKLDPEREQWIQWTTEYTEKVLRQTGYLQWVEMMGDRGRELPEDQLMAFHNRLAEVILEFATLIGVECSHATQAQAVAGFLLDPPPPDDGGPEDPVDPVVPAGQTVA